MARRKSPRILGPYEERGGRIYRIVLVDDRGAKHPKTYPTLHEALQVKQALETELGLTPVRTVSAVLNSYRTAKIDDGTKESSVDITLYRLRAFFKDVLDHPLKRLNRESCEVLYESYRTRPTRRGKPPAATTQLNVLEEAKTFGEWASYEKGWLRSNPLAGVKPKGKRKHGKNQLRITEARKWIDEAVRMLAMGGEEHQRATGALLTLYLGLREHEVLGLHARDIDDAGNRVWIADSKTEAGKRWLMVPDELQPELLAMRHNLGDDARVFPFFRGWVRKQVQRICRRAGVRVVSAQSMRGLHSTLATEGGTSGYSVAACMGHTSVSVTKRSYIEPGTTQRVAARRALAVLNGGKS